MLPRQGGDASRILRQGRKQMHTKETCFLISRRAKRIIPGPLSNSASSGPDFRATSFSMRSNSKQHIFCTRLLRSGDGFWMLPWQRSPAVTRRHNRKKIMIFQRGEKRGRSRTAESCHGWNKWTGARECQGSAPHGGCRQKPETATS